MPNTLEPLKVTPDVWLKFVEPLDTSERQVIRLENQEEKPVVFKVKTTANDLLAIGEPRGFLEAKGHRDVTITRRSESAADVGKGRLLIILSIYDQGGEDRNPKAHWDRAIAEGQKGNRTEIRVALEPPKDLEVASPPKTTEPAESPQPIPVEPEPTGPQTDAVESAPPEPKATETAEPTEPIPAETEPTGPEIDAVEPTPPQPEPVGLQTEEI